MGSIIGGYAYAISGMDVNVIGNSTEVKTQVHVGVSAQMRQETVGSAEILKKMGK